MTRHKIALSLLMLMPLVTHTAPYVYVANNNNNVVDVINTANNSVLTTITLPALPSRQAQPTCIAIAPNGQTVCVANSNFAHLKPESELTVSVINATLEIPTLTTTFSDTSVNFATCMAYTTDSNSLFIITNSGFSVYATDIATNPTVAGTFSSIPNPLCIAIGNTSNGETGYVGTNGAGIYTFTVPNIGSPSLIPNSDTGAAAINAITMAPNGSTAYAVGQDIYGIGHLYVINTTTNTLSNTINLGLTDPTGVVVYPDGNYIYITDNEYGSVIVIPTNNLSSITSFMSANSISLAVTPDSKQLYVIDNNANVSPYFVPAGTSAGSLIALGGSALAYSIVISPSLSAPASASGCKTQNVFLLQTDYINNITWTAPLNGSPAAYAIYRDAALTQLVSIVPANGPLQYYDHGRNPNVTDTYYIVSVDSSGNHSAATSVSVTQHC
jgi:YVTN family beta-propeller protein